MEAQPKSVQEEPKKEEYFSDVEKEAAIERIKAKLFSQPVSKEKGEVFILSVENEEKLRELNQLISRFYKATIEETVSVKYVEEKLKVRTIFDNKCKEEGINLKEYYLWHVVLGSGGLQDIHEDARVKYFDTENGRIEAFLRENYKLEGEI